MKKAQASSPGQDGISRQRGAVGGGCRGAAPVVAPTEVVYCQAHERIWVQEAWRNRVTLGPGLSLQQRLL